MMLYEDKTAAYYQELRHDLLQLVPDGPANRVLDAGAASGNLLLAIKQAGKASEVTGVDLFFLPNSNQQHPLVDRFIIANLEAEQLDLPEDYFDVLICGDVLEHLADPWRTLAYLTRFLKPGGTAIVSLPNVREIKTVAKIVLLGDFRYAPSGVLDKTHLRFFCKKNILALVASAALQRARVLPSFALHPSLRRQRLLNTLTLGIFQQFLAQQYLVVATK